MTKWKLLATALLGSCWAWTALAEPGATAVSPAKYSSETGIAGKSRSAKPDLKLRKLEDLCAKEKASGLERYENPGNSHCEELQDYLIKGPQEPKYRRWRYSAPETSSTLVPFIPWPPPKPSSRTDLRIPVLISEAQAPLGGSTLQYYGDIDFWIQYKLKSSGYLDVSYFVNSARPFPLVVLTPLEQIDSAGVPRPAKVRWLRNKDTASLSWGDYARKLLAGSTGRFRMMLFIISEEPIGIASYEFKETDIDRWSTMGMTSVPTSVRRRPVTSNTRITVFVYEFEADKGAAQDLKAIYRSALPAKTHLLSVGFSR